MDANEDYYFKVTGDMTPKLTLYEPKTHFLGFIGYLL